MQIVILAGGLGTRLRPLTRRVPKPMVPIAGRPFLERQIASLSGQGFQRFLLLTGYLGEQVSEHLGDGAALGVQIGYSREDEPLGTGGALRLAGRRLEERFLLLYGDSFLPENYARIASEFAAAAAPGLMVVYEDLEGRTGVPPNVAAGADGLVHRYAKGEEAADLRYIEAGVVGLTAASIGRLPARGPSSLERELYPSLIADGGMMAWITRERFYDIGTPEGLERAGRFFEQQEEGRHGDS